MTTQFTQTRDCELSILYHLETEIANDWSGISIIKTFKDVYSDSMDLPVVCVNLIETSPILKKEIGSTTLQEYYLISIHVFATSDGMRLDLAHYITDKLKDGWVHYLHSHVSGDKSSLSRTASGRDKVSEWITNGKIDPTDTIDQKDKFRHNIVVQIKHSTS